MIARITDRVFEPDDDALGQNEVPYLLKDLYTVAGLADERGWPVERYDYDAYGKVHMERVAVLPWAADFDGDGDVDQNDLTVFLDAYGGSGQAPNGPRGWRADLDGDGDVDGSDYVLFADAYNGAGNPPRRPQSPAVSAGCVLTTGSMVVGRVGNPFFFTGRRLDVFDKQDAGTPHHFTDDYAGLQLYDYRARFLLPDWGRFGQRDAIGYQDGANLYQYVKGMPMVLTDPSGQVVPIVIVVGGGIGIAEGVAAAFGLSLAACIATPPCARAVQNAIEAAIEEAEEAAEEIARGAMRCLCSKRHPTWMKCTGPSDPHSAAETSALTDAATAGGRAFVQECKESGPATNCPGGAPGTRYYCNVAFWTGGSQVQMRTYSINCCSCCKWIRSGISCKSLHMSGGGNPGGGQPPIEPRY